MFQRRVRYWVRNILDIPSDILWEINKVKRNITGETKRAKEEQEKKRMDRWRKEAMKPLFGFLPSSDPTMWGWEQNTIDAILRIKAGAFQEACDFQSRLLGQVVPSSVGEATKAHAELTRATSDVEIKKHGFWNPHAIAKAAGYQVKESHKDYLPQR